MPDVHARLSASASERWLTCAASLWLQENHGDPDTTSSYAEEGTAAHELAEKVLRSKNPNPDMIYVYEGMHAENGYEFTEDMCEDVKKYILSVMAYAEGNYMMVEERVDYSEQLGVPDSFGTADAIIISPDKREIQIHDLKFGRGKKVDAFQNTQLMCYAMGALAKYDTENTVDTVVMVIHQPRLNHYDEYVVSIGDMMEFERNAAIKAQRAVKIADGDAEVTADDYQPSNAACFWCKAKAVCPAKGNSVAQSTNAGDDFADLVPEKLKAKKVQLEALSAEQLSSLMDAADDMESYAKAIRARVEHELLSGNDVPNYKLVAGKRGSRAWSSNEEAEKLMKSMRLKKDEMYKHTLISPTQAAKLLKDQPKRWDRLDAIITQKEGKPSVAPASDKRAQYTTQPVEEDFKDFAAK